MRFERSRWLFNLIFLLALLAGLFFLLRPPSNEEIVLEGEKTNQPGDEPVQPGAETIQLTDEQRTLASFEKVNDFPLYTMTYYGDYGFDDYLKQGMATSDHSLLTPDHAWACTTFSTSSPDSDYLLGRNFDWYDHPALLLFTNPPEAYASVSMVDLHYLGFQKDQEPTDDAINSLMDAPYWTFDGMNEYGLAIGMMAVSQADPHLDPDSTTISSLEAIRLMLDYAKDVDEAIALLGQYNIDFIGGPPLHYLIADRNGDSVVVEFIDGEMVVLETGDPWQVSTNFLISIEQPQDTNSSCWRYNTSLNVLQENRGNITTTEGMTILESVAQSNTIWSILYNRSTGEISISVGRNFKDVHEFKLENFK